MSAGKRNHHMATNEYFDIRTPLNQPGSGGPACPVGSDKATLQRRQIKKRIYLFCPHHEIRVGRVDKNGKEVGSKT
jgi:hypothetical protein